MRSWGKIIVAAAAPLLLGGCLWGPGKFVSDLNIRKNGSFTLDYRGEILLQMPQDEDSAMGPWEDSFARCYAGGKKELIDDSTTMEVDENLEPEEEPRPCTPAEIAELKAAHAKKMADRAAGKRQESEEMAKVFGLPGMDDESNRRFAANLMKHQGWRAVTYKGKGVFDVDYHLEGRLTQDYVFPLMPQTDLIIPFITIRRRTDGAVMVTAPALTGGAGPFSARAKMLGMPDKSKGPGSKALGRFTVITDGEILTNNSEDGPAVHPAGRKVHWDVGRGSEKVPEMLIRL